MGQETLRSWLPAIVIPVQSIVVLLWCQMVFELPWSLYALYTLIGRWWVLPARLIMALLFIIVPVGFFIVDGEWLRLHRIPSHWTLRRIWLGTVSMLAVALVLTLLFNQKDVGLGVGVLLLFTIVTTVFLTVWWVKSHPLPASD
jgi:hypothetical protein